MYKKHTAYGTTVHTFEFNPETYHWTLEIGKSGQLESLQQIAPDADYAINWSVFDWTTGKNGYGRIQNGTYIIQDSSVDFPTVSFVNGKLVEGEFPEASPGFARWRVLVREGKVVMDFVADGNQRVKDARSAVGQLKNGNIALITVEGDDTKKRGLTGQELGQFAVDLGCIFCCDCDGGGSAACRTKDGYIYNQGRAIAGAMVVRKKEESKVMGKKKIFVDIGHGGTDPGAVANGLTEKEINLTVGLKLKELLLTKGFDVKLSRESDVYLSLTERTNMANAWGADYFISIHHNAGGGDGWEVIHTIHTSKSEGDELADAIGKEFSKTGQNMRRIFSRESTKYPGTDYYTVVNKAKMPSIITEFAFLDTVDYKAVDSVEKLHREAQAIANGLCNYLGVADIDITVGQELKGVSNVNWDEKNKEFVKAVQKAIGVEADGLAGTKTLAAFEEFAKGKSSSNSILKELLDKAIELLK